MTNHYVWLAIARAACASLAAAGASALAFSWNVSTAVAEPAASSTSENEAFAAAKELGTVEAWDAFLRNYPAGFHADLARAYVTKLGGAAAAVTPASSLPAAEQRLCKDVGALKSDNSDAPSKIRFVNQSGAVRVIQWVGFDGKLKEYFSLKPGEERVQETFQTHPWIAAYQEGSCRQVFMAGPGETVARLEADPSKPAAPAPVTKAPPQEVHETPVETCNKIGQDYNGVSCVPRKSVAPSKATIEQRKITNCVEIGMIYLNGKCAPKYKSQRQNAEQNKNKVCPAGMYRNPYGVCQPNETGN